MAKNIAVISATRPAVVCLQHPSVDEFGMAERAFAQILSVLSALRLIWTLVLNKLSLEQIGGGDLIQNGVFETKTLVELFHSPQFTSNVTGQQMVNF